MYDGSECTHRECESVLVNMSREREYAQMRRATFWGLLRDSIRTLERKTGREAWHLWLRREKESALDLRGNLRPRLRLRRQPRL